MAVPQWDNPPEILDRDVPGPPAWRFAVTDADPPSLDPPETTGGPIQPGEPGLRTPADDAAESSFRHSFWSLRRSATIQALTDVGASSGSIGRFLACGHNSWVYRSTADPSRYRIHTDKCHSRWCEACQVEHRRTVSRNLTSRLVDHLSLKDARTATTALRFVTLTLRSVEGPLAPQLDRIYGCFRQLRQRPFWKKHVGGGILFLELTLSAAGLWHPHLHILAEGDYLPHAQLRDEWKAITKDSFVVDVRLVRNPAIAAGYVAKYASKVVPASLLHERGHFHEAIAALKGRHTFTAFGQWVGWKLSLSPEDDSSWEPVGPLSLLLGRAECGDVAARRIILALRKEEPHANGTLTGPAPPSTPVPSLREPPPSDNDSVGRLDSDLPEPWESD